MKAVKLALYGAGWVVAIAYIAVTTAHDKLQRWRGQS